MAEVFGLVAGALSVAALFNNAVDCFEYIQLGRNFGTDYQTCQLRLDIARLRLSRWGAAVDINNDARFADANSRDDLVRTAKRTLEQLLNLFGRAYTESSDFKLTAGEDDLALFDPSTNNQAVITLRNTMHELAHKRQKRASLSKKISWALYRQKSFTRLIDDIQELLGALEDIFPRQETRKRMVEVEVEEIGEEPNLRVLSEAAQETDDLLREATSRKLEAIGSSNTVDKAKVADFARVRVGNESSAQGGPSTNTGTKMNTIRILDAMGSARVHVGDSSGETQFWSSH